MSTFEKITETTEFLKKYNTGNAKVAVVLGSGLGNFVQEIVVQKEIPYSDIPHFTVSTVQGHSGKLIFGTIAGKNIIAMAGRFHFYEGYAVEDVVFPIRVMKFLGVETVFLSNAAGGVNTNFKVGDLMIINDHISFFTVNPLLGKNEEALGTRFPDMTEPYSKALIAKGKAAAARLGFEIHEGVYTGVT